MYVFQVRLQICGELCSHLVDGNISQAFGPAIGKARDPYVSRCLLGTDNIAFPNPTSS